MMDKQIFELSNKERLSFYSFKFDYPIICYNCGVCSGICPLEIAGFPRKIMRFSQLKFDYRISMFSKDLWICLQCFLCSQACPKQADPSQVIHNLRSYMISEVKNKELWKRENFKNMLLPKDVVNILKDNIKKTKNPLGLKNSHINSWYKDLKIKKDGEYLIFTGILYQLIPYIEKMNNILEKIENSFLKNYISIIRKFPKFFLNKFFFLGIPKNKKEESKNRLRKIVNILSKLGVDYYYLPEIDNYSGILLHDLSDIDSFIEHANFVKEKLEENGVKKIITIDPHTTYAFKKLYPEYVKSNFEVYTYFEVIDKHEIGLKVNKKVTIHDPCYYGRYTEISHIPRRILRKLGVEIIEPKNYGEYTLCCGGPLESLYPSLSLKIALKRAEELKKTKSQVITMCPICLSRLNKAGLNAIDFADFLFEIFKGEKNA